MESKKDATPVSNGTPSELQSKVTELTSSLMKAEFEKKDLQFNLDKRSKEYKAVCDELEHMKSSFQTQKQQLEESTQAVADANATLSNLRSQIVSLFISFSQFLDVDCDREDDLKPALYSTVQNAFPEGSQSSDSNVEVVVLSAVDRVTMLKSRLRSIEGELKAKSNLLASQTKQISDLEGVSQSDRVLISRLQAKLDAQSSAVAETASQSSESGEMAELKHANEVLREAMGSLQTTLHQEQKRAETAEARLVQVQADLVGVQRSSNESVQQMQQAAEEKALAAEKEKEQLQLAADAAAVEASGLREALERTRKERAVFGGVEPDAPRGAEPTVAGAAGGAAGGGGDEDDADGEGGAAAQQCEQLRGAARAGAGAGGRADAAGGTAAQRAGGGEGEAGGGAEGAGGVREEDGGRDRGARGECAAEGEGELAADAARIRGGGACEVGV